MGFIRDVYRKDYAANTRETIRRQTIHQFEQARIVNRNPDDPDRPTNSGKTVYILTDHVVKVLRSYGTDPSLMTPSPNSFRNSAHSRPLIFVNALPTKFLSYCLTARPFSCRRGNTTRSRLLWSEESDEDLRRELQSSISEIQQRSMLSVRGKNWTDSLSRSPRTTSCQTSFSMIANGTGSS